MDISNVTVLSGSQKICQIPFLVQVICRFETLELNYIQSHNYAKSQNSRAMIQGKKEAKKGEQVKMKIKKLTFLF